MGEGKLLKEIFKKQLRKTGMVRSLEMENHDLKHRLKIIETDNKNLLKEIKILEKKQETLEDLNNKNVDLTGCVRGVSSDAGKPAILEYILDNVKKNEKILDVGFGSGIYCKMLRAFNYKNIEGVDVYNKNISEMGLDQIYDQIYIENILDFDFKYYDLIIFGDVLEHIELEHAKNLLSSYINENKCNRIIVSIPYEYEQDEVYGNRYEKHLQSEVNKEFMEEHYPYLKLIDLSIMPHTGGYIATYVWNKIDP